MNNKKKRQFHLRKRKHKKFIMETIKIDENL